MQLDELILKFKSEFGKVINDANSLISKFSKLDNTTAKVSNDFDKISKSASDMGNSFKASERNVQGLENRLNYLKGQFKEHVSIYKEWGSLATTKTPDNIKSLYGQDLQKAFGTPITKDSLLQEREEIDSLQSKIDELKATIVSTPKLKIVPKTDEGQKNLEKIGNTSEKTGRKFNNLKGKTNKLSTVFSKIGRSISGVGDSFSKISNAITRNVDKNFRSIKKLALGLIGVRTVMSLLTKSVNTYLSFDEQLQNSMTNSWNMLGSLLAPAIEMVANLFATATNYIYRFVQALTGIDLVARANAKALQSQAKATKGVANAQRGLLSMDEITNLPTEPSGGGGSDIAQITTKDINTKGIFSEFLKAIKQHKWHRAGEIIAEGINNGLRKINWEKVREKAQSTGRNIADFLNGVFELDWKLLGSSIANAINTAIDFIYGFVSRLNWEMIGKGIGDSITSFFETFDFNKLADTINRTAEGILTLFANALDHMDPELMGQKISNFLLRIDWMHIAGLLVKVLIKWIEVSLKTQWSMITNLSQELIQRMVDKTMSKLRDGGNKLGMTLAKAFVSAFKGVFNSLIWSLNTTLNPIGRVIDTLYKVNGKSSGIKMDWIPYLATGTPNIETEGIYHLHEGEMVVPRKFNPNTDGYDSGADNKQIIDLLISLNASMLEYADRPINVNMNSKKVAEAIYDDTQQITRNRNYSSVVTRS